MAKRIWELLMELQLGEKDCSPFPAVDITSFKVYLDDKNGGDNIRAVTSYLIDEKLKEK
jgi:hypothetical protein